MFCRPVQPGQTKTRLVPRLGAEGSARLYAAFLEDVLSTCRAVPGCEVEVWVAGDPEHRSLQLHDVPRIAQPQTDLGGRMQAALAHRPGVPTLVVGSDIPTLPRSLLEAALTELGRPGTDVVLGPATDGGFLLIGACGPRLPDLGPPIRWSHSQTLADTLAACRRGGLRVAQLTPWYDVDTPADLRVLSLHLALQPQAAPATAVVLASAGTGFLTPETRPR